MAQAIPTIVLQLLDAFHPPAAQALDIAIPVGVCVCVTIRVGVCRCADPAPTLAKPMEAMGLPWDPLDPP